MPWAVEPNNAADRLRRIEAVTDTALAHLSVEQLFEELLNRVRDLLDADTATVLLLDSSGEQLVATASSGIEEEVRQNVRVRVGEGFAGRIAAELKPYLIESVGPETVVNRILWEKGIRTMLGVPLQAHGEALGVLHVGTLGDRVFGDEDVRLLQLVADRIALATRSRLSHRDRAAAAAVQRSLLPARLPTVSGIEFGSRYTPGENIDVSGDWYDVFTVPSGWLCTAIGDVVGRGLPAALVMSRIRTATRAYAMETEDPAEVLARLDRHVRHFEPDAMATIAFAMWEPSHERVHLSLAGHVAPVLASPDEETVLVPAEADAPVGVGSSTRTRRTTTVEVPNGATLFFYTDGLVERRERSLENGLATLCEAVHPGPADAVCAEVMGKLVGYGATNDDVAVLAARRQDADNLRTLSFEVDAVPEALAEIRAQLRRWLPGVGASEDDVTDVLVAVGEAAANVIEHAYGPGGGKVGVRLETHGAEVGVVVEDTGTWRSPRGTHRGRGTDLMRQLCDDVRVEHGPHGTNVHLRKRLSGDQPE
ncbi:ATP-binding SpoIIE family protein phosphatase [Saccharomonospora saliphila]|uniref:ATP-binding SpoIIE family protein phosphatase n=1 Tax=Saccharomonospora saliphila TaxID=369829 RepID=UPI0003797CAB|nr:SpoIIE family protein phosphatase [Saccharomonospora saliphila]